ncbi:YgaP-like transmembrane domain [Chryseolinea sp. T2]|uniref:SRPBCC family protein n=1 Tax=Chryseolinea sp. T2 TaxID=3129255 RepID=UPI0030779116
MRAEDISRKASSDVSLLPPASGSSVVNVGTIERIVSVAGGALLATYGLRNKKKLTALPMLVAGGFLLMRGATGYCPVNSALRRNTAGRGATTVEASVSQVISKPRQEVYSYWRKLEHLPLFMKHLTSIRQIDETHSLWKAALPGNVGSLSWTAEIVDDQPGEYIAWSSVPGSTIDNAGYVHFLDAPRNSTEVKATIAYRLPGGDVGGLAAQLFNPYLQDLIVEDLKRFKYNIEGGVNYIRGVDTDER